MSTYLIHDQNTNERVSFDTLKLAQDARQQYIIDYIQSKVSEMFSILQVDIDPETGTESWKNIDQKTGIPTSDEVSAIV
jgi:hypothetical protein